MKIPEAPAPQDKCGAKIDYVAKRLGLALAPLGFKRKGRQLAVGGGEDEGRHWKIVQLQANSWNEGPRGGFYVNLAVQFPAITRLEAQRPGMAWLQDQADRVDESLGQLRQRLGALQAALPPEHPLARPAHSDEYKVNRDTDLVALADGVVQAMTALGLPWLDSLASLRALADFEGSLLGADVDVRVAAAVLLGDRSKAQQILQARSARFEHVAASYLTSVRTWFTGLGLDVSALPAEPAPPRESERALQRQAEQRAESNAYAQRAQALRQTIDDTRNAPAVLAQAWLAEQQAQWRQNPKPLQDLPSGADIARLDAAGRQAVLLALLQALVAAEMQAGPRPRFGSAADAFELDDAVRPLLEALLPTLDRADEATALAVVQAMQGLVTRWQHELATGGYPWGFAALAKWLTGPAHAAHRKALRPGYTAWLAAFGQFTLREWDASTAYLAAQRARAVDPQHPLHDTLMEVREREREAEARSAVPLPSPEEMRRRIGAYPEQQMGSADRQAVGLLRRELRRDADTGLLPVAWDDDDWGQAARQAWRDTPDALRQAVTPVLQGWLEGVQTKPTQRWMRELDGHIGALPPSQGSAWRNWLLRALDAFERCSGRIEWATTGARPGIGARLGEDSENLLLGLLWWTWRDPALHPDTLAATWQRVANGAWQRLPEVGARAPAVGGLVLRMLAGTNAATRARLEEQARAHGAAKSFQQAVQRALKEPLAR